MTESATRSLPAEPRVWLTVLGPLRAWRNDTELDLGTPQQQALLAVLAAHADHPVSVGHLVDVLWGTGPPASAVNLVHRYVGLLRRLLEPGLPTRTPGRLLVGGAGGYRLAVGDDAVDLLRFRRLRARADQLAADGRPDQALSTLRSALQLWRGPCAAGLKAQGRTDPVFAAIDAEYEGAVCAAADLALRGGGADTVLTVVQRAAVRNPLHEPLQARLIRLLGSAGQQAEALAVYQEIRSRLAEDLGVDPGLELRTAHATVLRQDFPALPADAGASADAGVRIDAANGAGVVSDSPDSLDTGRAAVAPATRPAQLPAELSTFSGRTAELGWAFDLLTGHQPPATVVISAIGGTAGVGKTTLALRWAHQVADRFPDGQLYVNLRGFGPTGSVVDPTDVVRGFLDALGVPAHRIPADLEGRSALYRSLLAGRRMLVLLDNARDVEQVRPLLPGSAGCLTIVTSRNQLAGLVAAEGAHPLTLDLLPAADARQLLASRLGAARLAAEPAAVDEIITRCAGLPLALAIVAARAATHPRFPLAAIAAELHDAQGSLEAFAGAEATLDARAAFSWSYHALSPPAARLFRLLGLHPGVDCDTAAAASLAGVPPGTARRLLAELTGAHLIAEHVPGRYTFHDLLRAYAAELGVDTESDADRRAAVHRLLDHYLHAADAADRFLEPHRDRIPLGTYQAGVTPPRIADHPQALAWFAAEHCTLLAAIRQAADAGFDTHAWQLTWAMQQFFDWRGRWDEWIATQRTALDAVLRQANHVGTALTRYGMGRAYSRLGRDADAKPEYERALDLFDQLGDRAGQARTHLNLGALVHRQGDKDQALLHAQCALDLYRAAGDRVGGARALNNIGVCQAELGNHELAIASYRQALAVHQELGDTHAAANAWDSLGQAHQERAEHQQAASCYQHALDLFREHGDRAREAETLLRLADTHRSSGDDMAARQAWRQALTIYHDLGHPQANRIRDLLHRDPTHSA